MALAPNIVSSDHIYSIATWQNVIIADFAGEVDPLRMRRLARAHRELSIAYPKGTLSFTIVRAGVPISSPAAREEAATFIKELGNSLLRSALIIEDTGVMASVLRTMVRGLNVVTRNTKLVLCDGIDEAVGALSPLIVPPQPGSDVRAELAAVVQVVRKNHDARPTRNIAQR